MGKVRVKNSWLKIIHGRGWAGTKTSKKTLPSNGIKLKEPRKKQGAKETHSSVRAKGGTRSAIYREGKLKGKRINRGKDRLEAIKRQGANVT